MEKRRIVNWFIAGLVAFVPALILIPSSALAWAAHLSALGPANAHASSQRIVISAASSHRRDLDVDQHAGPDAVAME